MTVSTGLILSTNPFRTTVVTDPWQSGPGDVPEIHGKPFSICVQALEAVRKDGRTRSVLLYGEAGSGKTHLLGRLRRHWLGEPPHAVDPIRPEVVFVAARLQTSPQHLWRYVRHSLVEDMLRPVPGSPSQLERILLRRLAEIRPADADLGLWFEWMKDQHPEPSALREQMEELFDELDSRLRLGRDLCTILIHLLTGRHRRDSKAWLRGDSLPAPVLDRLEIAPPEEDVDQEDEARRMVGALCRLAGRQIPVVFCFDQIEALQLDRNDSAALFSFGRVVMELFQETENVLIITCSQSSFITQLEKSMLRPAWERLAMERGSISPLRWHDARLVIQARLSGVAELADPRADHPENPVWPLEEGRIKAIVGPMGATARQILSRCADLFDSLDMAGSGKTEISPVTSEETLHQAWESRLERASRSSEPERSGDILAQSLPMLVRLKAAEWERVAEHTLRDVNMLWKGPDGRVGVYLCNETDQRRVVHPLKRLPDLLRTGRLEKLVIVRDARLPIDSPKAREYLQNLIGMGAHEVRPTAEVLAALDALRSLLSDAKAGDLDHQGEPVPPQSVEEWLLAHLPEPLGSLAESLMSHPSIEGSTEDRDNVLKLLGGRPVVALDEAASMLKVSSADLEETVQSMGEMVGLLSGPPTVIFRLEGELADA